MSVIGIIIFTAAFTAVAMYFGNYYTKLGMSKGAWLIVTIALCAAMVIDLVAENVIMKKKE